MLPAIDMRPNFPGARDQGPRPTCLAFAVSDAHMFASRRPSLLAADYLHFHASRRANVPQSEGVGASALREALQIDGQPFESECPYSTARSDSWVPPSNLGAIWTRESTLPTGTASNTLTTALAAERVDVLVLRVSRSFHMPDLTSHVVVEDGDKGRRLHAVAIVGTATINGDVAFLARNSWGVGWGDEGHAWLPLAYVDARAVHIIKLEVV